MAFAFCSFAARGFCCFAQSGLASTFVVLTQGGALASGAWLGARAQTLAAIRSRFFWGELFVR